MSRTDFHKLKNQNEINNHLLSILFLSFPPILLPLPTGVTAAETNYGALWTFPLPIASTQFCTPGPRTGNLCRRICTCLRFSHPFGNQMTSLFGLPCMAFIFHPPPPLVFEGNLCLGPGFPHMHSPRKPELGKARTATAEMSLF